MLILSLQLAFLQLPGYPTGAKQAFIEPRTLFITKGYDLNGHQRLNPLFYQTLNRFERAEHSDCSIIAATIRLRIDV
ncbi:hypothetical protein D3C73_1471740 [compost metagenome]